MKKLVLLACLFSGIPVMGMHAAQPLMNDAEYLRQRVQNAGVLNFEEMLGLLGEDRLNDGQRELLLEQYRSATRNSNSLFSAYTNLVLLNKLLEPKNMGFLSLGALGVFGAWHASGLVRDVISHKLLIPPLAQKTSMVPWYSFKKKPDPITLDQVILNDSLTEQAHILLNATKYGAEHDLLLRHFLFYGPPGTGKTMLALAIAQQAGLEYIYFSAAKLNQYSEEEGVRQITCLFEFASAYPKKLMIVMDEVDGMLQDRYSCPPKMLSFLTTILTYMGTLSEHFMVVGITNRPQDLDEASKERFGVKLEIGAPGFDERLRLLMQYASQYFTPTMIQITDKRPWYRKLLGSTARFREPLKIAPDITEAVLIDLAQQTEGFVGRDISDMLLAVQFQGYYSTDKMVTKDMLYGALKTKKEQDSAEYQFAQARKRRKS